MARVESGVIKFGDDWPGVFFRGDTAIGYAMQLQRAIALLAALPEADDARFMLPVLDGLLSELLACDTRRAGVPVTHMKPAEDCYAKF